MRSFVHGSREQFHTIKNRPQVSNLVLLRSHSRLLFLSTWPSHFNLLRHTSQLTLWTSADSVTVLCVIFCCHLFLSIRRKHCYWKVSSLLSSAFVIFQVSQPYSRTRLSNVLTRRILVLLPCPLADHSFPSLWNVLCAFCRLFLMSLRPLPSLST